MEIIDGGSEIRASIYYRNKIIYDINDEFVNLTGYKSSDVIGKSLEDLKKLLRANVNISCQSKGTTYQKYIFTRKDKPIHIDLSFNDLNENDKEICFIAEDSNLFLEGLLASLVENSEDNRLSTAIYSYPDLIHLKTNRNYAKKSKYLTTGNPNLIGQVFSPRKCTLDSFKKNGFFFQDDMEIKDDDGNSNYWTIKADLIYEKDKAKYLKAVYINDTEKVLARKSIEKQKSEMEETLDNIPDSIIRLNKQGDYTYINKSALERFSLHNAKDDLLNNNQAFKRFNYHDIKGKELSFKDLPAVRLLKGDKISNYMLIMSSHLYTSYNECNGVTLYDSDDNIEGAILIFRNINDSLKTEEYGLLVENIENLEVNYATISAKDFKIKYINNNGFKSIKKSFSHIHFETQVIGQDFFNFYCDNASQKQEIIDEIKLCVKDTSSKYIHNQMFIEDGKISYVKTIFQPIFDNKNQVKQVSCIGMYITDEELANQRMSKSLEAQEEIFINTSHELKTPINLIFSASQLLSIYLKAADIQDKKDQIIHSNRIIKQNCYRTIKLINNILDVSRIEKGYYELNLENIDIVNAIDDMVMSVADYIKDKQLTIIFDTEIEEKIIALDLYKFERIMLNLISNAIKFSKAKGLVFIDLVDRGDFLEVSVRDNGIGIDEKNIASIFNKFKQENKSLNRSSVSITESA